MSDFLNQKVEEPMHEEVTGAMECQECYHVANEAKYFPESETLAWKCAGCEEINKIKMKL